MGALNPEIRERVVQLRMEEGLSYSQIGARLGISKNSAIGYAHRAGVPSDERFFPVPHPKRDQIKAELAIGRPVSEIVKMTGAPSKRVHEYKARMKAAGELRQPLSPALMPREIVAATLGPVSALSSRITCQYVTGPKPSPLQPAPMCGAPAKAGKSWCPTHYDLCCRQVKGLSL